MWYPQQRLPVWGLAIRHMEWATHLNELERLSVGSRGDWGDTLKTFLPEDGLMSSTNIDQEMEIGRLKLDQNVEGRSCNGTRILLDKMMRLSKIVSSVTADEGGVRL